MKVTGTDLKKLLSSRKDVREAFTLEVLAERLAVDDGMDESDMDRGVRLEPEAIKEFETLTGKQVELVGICEREDNPFIAYSPDGLIKNNGKYTEGVEVKCLSSKNHVKAWLTNQIPEEYYAQAIQSFIVNDDQQTLYFVLYDPRIRPHPLHIIPIRREEVADKIEEYRQKQEQFLREIEAKLEEIIKL